MATATSGGQIDYGPPLGVPDESDTRLRCTSCGARLGDRRDHTATPGERRHNHEDTGDPPPELDPSETSRGETLP